MMYRVFSITLLGLLGILLPPAVSNAKEKPEDLEACAVNSEGQMAGLCSSLLSLKGSVGLLNQVVRVEADGTVRIVSTGDLVLVPGAADELLVIGDTLFMEDTKVMGTAELEGDATLMQDLMVMGDTELEGAAMMMSDAKVMGTAELEGDTMFMNDATVMGDAAMEGNAMVEGILIIVGQSATVSGGELVPDFAEPASSIRLREFLEPLIHIPPAPNDGTALELVFIPNIPPDPAAPPTSIVLGCDEAAGTCAIGPGQPNIVLRPGSFSYTMPPEATLTLISDGPFWRERSRSSGQVEPFLVTETKLVTSVEDTDFLVDCVTPPQGRPGAIFLSASVPAYFGLFFGADFSHIRILEKELSFVETASGEIIEQLFVKMKMKCRRRRADCPRLGSVTLRCLVN